MSLMQKYPELKRKAEQRKTGQDYARLAKLREIRAKEEGRAAVNAEIIAERNRILKARAVNQKAKPLRTSSFGGTVSKIMGGGRELMLGMQDISRGYNKPARPYPRRVRKKRMKRKYRRKPVRKQASGFYNPFSYW